MKDQNGIALPVLIIIIVAIIFVTSIIINHAKKIIEENKLKDLTTNMLFIQAETKKGLEEVCFQTVNLNASKEEDLAKIKQIKQDNLHGIPVKGSEIESRMPQEISIDENCYYLDETVLNDIGVKNLNPEQYGYFLVKYDFTNSTVEVINTKGYEGKYTLKQLIEE